MNGDADLAAVAAAIGEPARARMLSALGDGRALAAHVLASEAGVAPSTASAHLARLVEAGLVAAERRGRHRYFRLAGADVGRALEALAQIAPCYQVRSLREGTRAHALRLARTCYDHLAGRLGVALMDALLERRILEGLPADGGPGPSPRWCDYRLTGEGAATLSTLLGVEVGAIPRSRPLVRHCRDWSEQRHHLAGGLGAALATRLIDCGWLRRLPNTRALLITESGRVGLRERLGVGLAG